MKTPDVDIATVVRIECLMRGGGGNGGNGGNGGDDDAGDTTRHRLEWGMRWGRVDPRATAGRQGWIVSQRYVTRDSRGATVYPWIDLFDVLVGGKEYARGFVMPWIYARADALVMGEMDAGMIEPWQYVKGLTREERLGGRRGFRVVADDGGSQGKRGVVL